MKYKFYIVKENQSYSIYKVDYGLTPAFEQLQRENIVLKAQDLQDLIFQYDRQAFERLELNKRVRTVSIQSENYIVSQRRVKRNSEPG